MAKHLTTQNTPHSRNAKETISSYNSTPVKSSPGKNHITINVQAYRPRMQAVATGYQPLTKERKGHRHRKDNRTEQMPKSALGESRNHRAHGKNAAITDGGGTTQSQSSSKKQSASQMQIQQAREQ